jgi:hypothetical protein
MFALKSDDDRRRLCESVDHYAFGEIWRKSLTERGIEFSRWLLEKKYGELIDALIDSSGLSYGEAPKALIPFHRYEDGARTAFEEHLVESCHCFSDVDGTAAIHFTIGDVHRSKFVARLEQYQKQRKDGRSQVTFSAQHPATDTIAMDANGDLLRTRDHKPVVRPGGHGALIENLNELQGDLIFVKNIDNVQHGPQAGQSPVWIQALGGFTVQLQEAIHEHLRALQVGEARSIVAASNFVQQHFPSVSVPRTTDWTAVRQSLIECLSRPLRICGMVRNEGEPGGGPFWVHHGDGSRSLQIVETSEIDLQDSSQRAAVDHATHFNPVFMALAVRDPTGRPYDLHQYVDRNRAITTQKSVNGRTAHVLERPGLWNGGMAMWNSVFVEVPGDVFTPVKTVFDLLREEHQPVCHQASTD